MIYININEQVDTLKELIKNNSINKEGELVELHQDALEFIGQDFIYQLAVNEAKKQEDKKEKAIYYKNKNDFIQTITNLYGSFYFSFYNSLPKIPKQYLFRFIYLSTYLKFNDNRLMVKAENDRYKLIYEHELQDLLKLGKTEFFKTKKELINNNLIHINNDKTIHINNKISINGTIGGTKRDYIRVFNESIQEIYNKSLPKEHKQLYIFLELLPYINYNLNVLCFNPKETQPDLIEPLTIEDITNILNMYKGNNKYKLQELLLNTFVNDEKTLLIIKDYKKEFFVVNPRIYYKGNNVNDLNYLYSLFKI